MRTNSVIEVAGAIIVLAEAGKLRNPMLRQAAYHARLGNTDLLSHLLRQNANLEAQVSLAYQGHQEALESHPFLPWPTVSEAFSLAGTLPLGRVNPQGQVLGLEPEDLLTGLLVLGTPGRGKTQLILKLLENAAGKPWNVLIFDMKKDYRNLAARGFTVLKNRDIRFNHFEPVLGDTHEEYMASCIEILAEENFLIDLGKRLLTKGLRGYYRTPRSIDGRAIHPNYSDLAHHCSMVGNTLLKTGGMKNKDIVTSLAARLEYFIDTGTSFNSHFGHDAEFWLNNNLVIELGDMPDFIQRVFIISLWNKIFRFMRCNNIRNTGLRTLLVFDEGYRFFDATREKNHLFRDTTILTLLRQSREFGIGWIVGAQEPGSITSSILNNAAHVASFPLYASSLDTTKKLLGLDDDQAAFFMNKMPMRFCGVVRTPKADRPLLFSFSPQFASSVPAIEASNAALSDAAKTGGLSRHLEELDQLNHRAAEQSGHTIGEYRKNEQEKHQAKIDAEYRKHCATITEVLTDQPFTGKTELMKTMGLNPQKFGYVLDRMQAEGKLKAVKCYITKRHRNDLFVLTAGGPISPSHFRHTFYCQCVKEFLLNQGKRPMREYNATNIPGGPRIDVAYLEGHALFAFEITLTFSNLVDNVNNALGAGAEEVSVVVEKEGVTRAEKMIQKHFGLMPEEVKVRRITDFLT